MLHCNGWKLSWRSCPASRSTHCTIHRQLLQQECINLSGTLRSTGQGMRTANIHSYELLANKYICFSCRKASLNVLRQPSFRPLHASPSLLLPRRRDFFSSNSALFRNKLQAVDLSKDDNSPSPEQGQTQKRKSARSPAGKTSLRRAAIEAQRSKDGSLVVSKSAIDGTSTPKLVTAYAVAEQFDLAKVVEILHSKGYEPDPLGTGLYPQVVHVQIPLSSIYRASNPSAKDLAADEIGDVFIFPQGP